MSSLGLPDPAWSTKNQPLTSSFISKAIELTDETKELETIISEQDTSDLRGWFLKLATQDFDFLPNPIRFLSRQPSRESQRLTSFIRTLEKQMRNDRELSQSLLEDEHPSEHTHD
jgi:hypothetical protein